jgi:pyruvate dehydrogenase E2 component (dihydrolipoamide acetyltransferase)
MRQAIAEHMLHSLQTMAQVSMNTTADVTELKSTREAFGARWGGRKPSYTDFLVKAVTVALQEHPLLGAKLEGDEIVMPTETNIGVAVALEDGLIVPVVRNADRLSLLAIGDKVKDLAERARQNALAVEEEQMDRCRAIFSPLTCTPRCCTSGLAARHSEVLMRQMG